MHVFALRYNATTGDWDFLKGAYRFNARARRWWRLPDLERPTGTRWQHVLTRCVYINAYLHDQKKMERFWFFSFLVRLYDTRYAVHLVAINNAIIWQTEECKTRANDISSANKFMAWVHIALGIKMCSFMLIQRDISSIALLHPHPEPESPQTAASVQSVQRLA